MCQPGRPSPHGDGHAGSPGFGVLPQHEIERVVFARRHVHAFAGPKFVERFAGELAVTLELADGVIHVAIPGAVGKLAPFERADHVDHRRHVLRGARLVIGFLDAERRGIFVHRGYEAGGQRLDRLVVLLSALDDLVLDVRDVLNVGDAKARCSQPPPHDVESDHDTRVSEVAVVVDGHSADVHAHLAGRDRNERLLLSRKRVIDLQHSGSGEVRGGVLAADANEAGSSASRRLLCGVYLVEFRGFLD